MSEQTSQEMTHDDILIIDDGVIEKITCVVTRQIDGILDMKGSLMSGLASSFGGKSAKGVTASVEGAAASIEIKAILEYGASAPDIFEQIKTAVRREVKNMTGLDVKDIQFRIVDVMTQEEFDRSSREVAKKAQS